MSLASVTVDSTVGGVAIANQTGVTRLVLLANTGSVTAYLKMDQSDTPLTATNGHPLAANAPMSIGLLPGRDASETNLVIRGITASGSTTITAQMIPN